MLTKWNMISKRIWVKMQEHICGKELGLKISILEYLKRQNASQLKSTSPADKFLKFVEMLHNATILKNFAMHPKINDTIYNKYFIPLS